MAEVRIKVFKRDLQKNLFPDNAFYKKSKVDGASSAESIEIPQAESPVKAVIGNVQVNYDDVANNLTAANKLEAVKRINSKKTYENQNIFVPPVIIDKNNEDGELSYEKRAEIQEEFALELNTQVANYAAERWAPTNINRITGTTGTETRLGLVTGGLPGPVKRATYKDLLRVKKFFQKMNLPKGGKIYALPTSEFWEDIMLMEEFRSFEKTGLVTLLKDGTIGKWLGITWMEPRNNEDLGANIIYDYADPANPVKVSYESVIVGGRNVLQIAPTATTVSGVLFWHERMVRRSEGRVNGYFRKDDPFYQADILSSNVRFGATSSRADEKGVVALIETPDA